MTEPLLRGHATDEPVVPWLNALHQELLGLADEASQEMVLWVKDTYGQPIAVGDARVVRARIVMERLLLDPHEPVPVVGRHPDCVVCRESFGAHALVKGVGSWPCEPWWIVAAGWRMMPGYQEEWAL